MLHFLTASPVKVEPENFLGWEREMEFLKWTVETENNTRRNNIYVVKRYMGTFGGYP